jgi:hypothetical protein
MPADMVKLSVGFLKLTIFIILLCVLTSVLVDTKTL